MSPSYAQRELHRRVRIAMSAMLTGAALACADIQPDSEVAVAAMALEGDPLAGSAGESGQTEVVGPIADPPFFLASDPWVTSFAAIGEPRPILAIGEAPRPWPSYNAATDRHMSLKSTSVAAAGLSKADCDFLGSIGAVL